MNSIWIINQYIGTPSMGVGGHRHYYFAKSFAEIGHEVTLITSTFSHVPKKNVDLESTFAIQKEEGFTVGLVKTGEYASARGLGRMWSMFVFMLKLFFFPFSKVAKPDVVIVSSISLLPILNGLYIRWRYDCKLILEIRDIWPLSIIELGGFRRYNPFVLFLRWVELLGYKKYDYITSLLPLTKVHIEQSLGRPIENFCHIPNGIFMSEKLASIPLNIDTKKLIPKDKFVVGYAGSLGVANAMGTVIEAANMFDDDIALCIVGDGYEKERLMKLSTNVNTIFLAPVPKQEIVSLLDEFDVLIISWDDIPLYRFGVSANKIFDYMYSGKPIIMAGNIGENVVELAQCGIVVKPNDSDLIHNAVMKLKEASEAERKIMGSNGRDFVERHNSYEVLTARYETIFRSFEL